MNFNKTAFKYLILENLSSIRYNDKTLKALSPISQFPFQNRTFFSSIKTYLTEDLFLLMVVRKTFFNGNDNCHKLVKH